MFVACSTNFAQNFVLHAGDEHATPREEVTNPLVAQVIVYNPVEIKSDTTVKLVDKMADYWYDMIKISVTSSTSQVMP